ncbi:MAG: ABC transporter permease [Neofamilia sp.]
MTRYILKRVISSIITILFIMTITFILMNILPGNPFATENMGDPKIIAVMMEKYGLDKPLHERYFKYITDYVQGNFGVSYQKVGLTVNEVIGTGFPFSMKIGGVASLIVLLFGVVFGVIAALRQNTIIDKIFMVFATLGATIPSFVFATMFLYVFSKLLGWVPSFGLPNWKGYIGPAVVISLFSLSYVTRLMRSTMLDVLNQDYIRTAKAKGLSSQKIIIKHAMRNAILPIVSYIGPMIAAFLTGSLVVEKVFGIPGIGNLFTNSVLNRDYTMIMGMTVFFAIILVLFVLVVDIVYVLVDPRIKFE